MQMCTLSLALATSGAASLDLCWCAASYVYIARASTSAAMPVRACSSLYSLVLPVNFCQCWRNESSSEQAIVSGQEDRRCRSLPTICLRGVMERKMLCGQPRRARFRPCSGFSTGIWRHRAEFEDAHLVACIILIVLPGSFLPKCHAIPTRFPISIEVEYIRRWADCT